MARYVSGGGSASHNNMIASALSAIVNKEDHYKEGILKNHALCKSAAVRLAISGNGTSELERALQSITDNNNDNDTENDAWLQEQRERLKKLAMMNTENERMVQDFVAAANTLKTNILHADPAAAETNDDEIKDYQDILQTIMNDHRRANRSTLLPLEEEKFYREICDDLGEKIPKQPKNKNRRSGRRSNGDDEDDDIEVIRNNGTQAFSLKCPLSGTYLEEPVKNKVCGHLYSKEAILHHIQTTNNKQNAGRRKKDAVRDCNCPVAGCSALVTPAQLERDIATETLVRREVRRQEKASQQRATRASMLDDDEEEETYENDPNQKDDGDEEMVDEGTARL